MLMLTKIFPALYYQGHQLKTGPAYFGELRDANDLLNDAPALHQRMAEDGYLYLPGLLDRDKVLTARRSVLQRLWDEGALDTNAPLLEGVLKPDVRLAFRADLAARNPEVETLLYDGEMMHFFHHFLGGPATHFDFTWLRAKSNGAETATTPHCDIVFMSRGTQDLYTAWTPLDDVSYEMGGLMVLEGSHQRKDVLGEYWEFDVDTYCVNGEKEDETMKWSWSKTGGSFSKDAIDVREQIGGRWLTKEFAMGDVLIFCMQLLHASMDNQTNRVRLSTDTRYQLAAEPLDPRWIGENPIAHSSDAKQGLIC
jgi:hypothetical protein